MKPAQRPHLMQQRHHLMMRRQARARGEGHRRGGGARDQQQNAIGRIAHRVGQGAQPRDPAAVIVQQRMRARPVSASAVRRRNIHLARPA